MGQPIGEHEERGRKVALPRGGLKRAKGKGQVWETHSQTIRSDNWRNFRAKCLFQCGDPAGKVGPGWAVFYASLLVCACCLGGCLCLVGTWTYSTGRGVVAARDRLSDICQRTL